MQGLLLLPSLPPKFSFFTDHVLPSSISAKPSLLSNLPPLRYYTHQNCINNKKKRNQFFRVWPGRSSSGNINNKKKSTRDRYDYEGCGEWPDVYDPDDEYPDDEYPNDEYPDDEYPVDEYPDDLDEFYRRMHNIHNTDHEINEEKFHKISLRMVDFKINEDEFHKISIHNCNFFIRKPQDDPDNDAYDFREVYVTPPDNDVYYIPQVFAPMPEEYVRCTKKEYYRSVPIEYTRRRDPLSEYPLDISKVFLIKHDKNKRINDPELFLDFEETYILHSETMSITKEKVLVTDPEGKNRDRLKDMLIVRENEASFKIIPMVPEYKFF